MLHRMWANCYSSQNSDKTGVCRAGDGNTHTKNNNPKTTTKTQCSKKEEEGEAVSAKVDRKEEKKKGFSKNCSSAKYEMEDNR